ncbi:hypothetical protein CALCODRAFT_504404, partial [Calocera cornea HHB12733]
MMRTYNPKITRKEPGDKSSYLQSGKKRQKERKVVQDRRDLPLDFTLPENRRLNALSIDGFRRRWKTAHNAHYWLQAVQLMQEAIRIHSKQNDISDLKIRQGKSLQALERYADAVEVYEGVQAGARDCLVISACYRCLGQAEEALLYAKKALLSDEMARLRSQGDLQLWKKASHAQDEANRVLKALKGLTAYFQSQYARDHAVTSETWQNFRSQCEALEQQFSIWFAGETLQQEKLRWCLSVGDYDWAQSVVSAIGRGFQFPETLYLMARVAYMRNDLHSAAGSLKNLLSQEPGHGYGQALLCAVQQLQPLTHQPTLPDCLEIIRITEGLNIHEPIHNHGLCLAWYEAKFALAGMHLQGRILCTLMSQFIDNVCRIETLMRPSNVFTKSCVLLCTSSAQSKIFPLEPACFRNTSPSSRTEDRHALVDGGTSFSLLMDNGIWLGPPV